MSEVITPTEAIDQARINPESMAKRFTELFKVDFKESFTSTHDPDEDIDADLAKAESQNLETLNKIKSIEETHNLNIEEIREILDAAMVLEYIEEVDPANVNAADMTMIDPADSRMVFQVGGNFISVTNNLHKPGLTPSEARSLIRMEATLLGVEQRSRAINGGVLELEKGDVAVDTVISRFTNLSNAESNSLKIGRQGGRRNHFDTNGRRPITARGLEIKKQIIKKLNETPTELESVRMAELFKDMVEVDDFEMDLAQQEDVERDRLKAEEQEITETSARIEKYKNRDLADKLAQISSYSEESAPEGNRPRSILLKILQEMTDAANPDNPNSNNLNKSILKLEKKLYGKKEFTFANFQKEAMDILIAHERAVNPNDGYSIESALPILASKESFDIDTLEQTLSDVELRNFMLEMQTNSELFKTGARLSEEQQTQKDEILSLFSDLAKKNLLNGGLINQTNLESEIPTDLDVYKKVLNERQPAITDLMPFLNSRELTSLCRMLYLRDGISHFDEEGKPLPGDARSQRILDTFLPRAQELARNHENEALAEKVKSDFEKSEVGQLISSAKKECNEIILKNPIRVWREGNRFIFSATERNRRRTVNRNSSSAKRELSRLERFEKFYLLQSGRYETTVNQMQRNMAEELERIGDRELTANEERDFRKNATLAYLQHEFRSRIIRMRFVRLGNLTSLSEGLKSSESSIEKFAAENIGILDGYPAPDLSEGSETRAEYDIKINEEIRKIIETNQTIQGNAARQPGERSIYDIIMDAANGDPEMYRDLVRRFNSEHGASALWDTGEALALTRVFRGDLKKVVAEGNPAQVIDLLDRQSVNRRIQDKMAHRLFTETRRFARRERGRQRLEGLVQDLTGIPDAKLDDIHAAGQYFEAGDGWSTSLFRGTIQARYRVANSVNAVARGWHASNAVIFGTLGRFPFAPYSERFHDRLDMANDRRAELRARNTERLRRLQRIYGEGNELFWFRNINPEIRTANAARTAA